MLNWFIQCSLFCTKITDFKLFYLTRGTSLVTLQSYLRTFCSVFFLQFKSSLTLVLKTNKIRERKQDLEKYNLFS